MQPSEKSRMTNDMADERRDAISQLSGAQARAEADLLGGRDALLGEGVRRAEAVLFAAGEPLSAEQIAEILPQGIEAGEVLMALRAVYSKRGVNLVEVAGKWRFQTAQDLSYLFVEERQVQKKLGQASLETLAIIAYGQPVTRAEIEAVRGVAVAKSVIDTLVESGWVRVRGRRKTPGLPITYGTTDKFLEHFGLESLDTLPGKADLEAEGLLTDVIPSGFQMPDEEALSEEDTLISDLGNIEDVEAFVTDFMGDETTPPSAGQPAAAIAETDEEGGEDDPEGGLSVFAYTRAPKPEADPEAFGRDAVQAAVRKMRNESRMAQQPMHTWREDE
ncbi:MAG: SMC-Scp complex subunit ScpB [Hyphomonas sp.]|uniref:SMC-Scp complex subunit ScpB n=1 Tax=Hyphomonas sp. TaxID=87 RepID=UPI00349FEBAD